MAIVTKPTNRKRPRIVQVVAVYLSNPTTGLTGGRLLKLALVDHPTDLGLCFSLKPVLFYPSPLATYYTLPNVRVLLTLFLPR